MFTFLDDLSDTYTWPVVLKLPANGGKTKEVKFVAEFNRLSADQERELTDDVNGRVKQMLQRAKDYVSGSGEFEAADEDDMMKINLHIRDQVLVSVGECDKAGNYTAADGEKAGQLLSLRGATEAILAAYGKSKSGEKAKN